MADIEQKKTVYLSFHENFVREGIPYTDKTTGEQRTFNQVRIPSGTIIDGQDMGGYEFSPLYVNESKYKGAAWRDVPMLADREVWLQKSILDPEGNPVLDEAGRRQKDTVKVMPQQIKDALAAPSLGGRARARRTRTRPEGGACPWRLRGDGAGRRSHSRSLARAALGGGEDGINQESDEREEARTARRDGRGACHLDDGPDADAPG